MNVLWCNAWWSTLLCEYIPTNNRQSANLLFWTDNAVIKVIKLITSIIPFYLVVVVVVFSRYIQSNPALRHFKELSRFMLYMRSLDADCLTVIMANTEPVKWPRISISVLPTENAALYAYSTTFSMVDLNRMGHGTLAMANMLNIWINKY